MAYRRRNRQTPDNTVAAAVAAALAAHGIGTTTAPAAATAARPTAPAPAWLSEAQAIVPPAPVPTAPVAPAVKVPRTWYGPFTAPESESGWPQIMLATTTATGRIFHISLPADAYLAVKGGKAVAAEVPAEVLGHISTVIAGILKRRGGQ